MPRTIFVSTHNIGRRIQSHLFENNWTVNDFLPMNAHCWLSPNSSMHVYNAMIKRYGYGRYSI